MKPLDIPPGVMQRRSKAPPANNWFEANLIRWDEGTMMPVAGWEKSALSGLFASRVRATHKWIDNSGVEWIAYLCEQHLYVESGGVLSNISPTPALASPYSGSYIVGGYGDDKYGTSTYGTARPVRPRVRPYTPSYRLSNWGEELRAMTSADGRYLKWDPSVGVGTAASVVATAPINNRTFVITPERHVILFGVGGDLNRVGWCSQEDDTDWNFASVLNTAGDLPVEPSSPIVTAKLMGSDVIFFTSNGHVHILRYIGTPYIYAMDSKGKGPIPYSADAVGVVAEGAIWMSQAGFWSYDGNSIRSFPCEIWDWIKEDIDEFYTRYECVAIDLAAKNELWFCFVGKGQQYNTKFAMLDYAEGYKWSMGQIGRSAGFSYPNDDNPVMADGLNVYVHEQGNAYADYAGHPFIETFNLGSGSIKTTLRQLFPEVDGDFSVLRFSVMKANSRLKDSETQSSLRTIRDNGYVDIRETARDLRLRIEAVSVPSEPWSVGEIQIDAIARGQK